MFCPKCGKENPEGSLFCNSCGAKVSSKEVNNVKINNEQEESKLAENTLQDNKKSNKKSKVIRCIVVVFIIIAILVVSLYLYVLNHIKSDLSISLTNAEKYAKENKYNDALLTLNAAHIPDSSVLSMYMGGKIIYGKLNNEVESKCKEYTYESYVEKINKLRSVNDFNNNYEDYNNNVPANIRGYFKDLKDKGYTDKVNQLYSVVINKMRTTLNQDKVFGKGISELLTYMGMDSVGDKNTLRQIYELNKSYRTKWQMININTIGFDDSVKVEREADDYRNNRDNHIKSEPRIGMTADEVRESTWGNPSHINKTTTANGTSEQWVYSDNKYIYIENGVVTAIQE